MSAPESARIQEVYGEYGRDPGKRQAWSTGNPGNRAILAERGRRLRERLQAHGLLGPDRRVLDIGCGRGELLGQLRDWGIGATGLSGIDLLEDRVEQARSTHPDLDIRLGDATRLPYADASHHAVCLFTVMSSILDPDLRAAVAAEVRRVLRPGGKVVWYDLRRDNPRNPHVRGIGEGTLAELFSGFDADVDSVTLVPPLARRLGPATGPLYPVLARVPWLRTHLLGILTKP